MSLQTFDTAREGSARGQFSSEVISNRPLCREHYGLTLRLASFPPTEPGQFVQVACRDLEADYSPDHITEWSEDQPPRLAGRELLEPVPLLRRPFSLAGRCDTSGGVELYLIHRVVGAGTSWMAGLEPGDRVGVIGPLGNRFALPAEGGLALLVGGGVGIPPMIYLAEKLAGRRAIVFSGALTRDLLPLTLEGDAPGRDAIDPRPVAAEFSRHNIPAVISTDDGTYGFRGFVTQALDQYLDRHFPRSALSTQHSALPVLYTCGPEPMMRRVADIAAARGLECQVAVERAMACGMGTCQSCCIRVRKPDPAEPPLPGRDWCYRLACTDGPVFKGADLLW